MKNIYLVVLLFLLVACGGTQKTTNYLESGNYKEAFNNSVAQLRKDKSNQKHVPLLKEAFDKAAQADLNTIQSLANDSSPEALKKIYGTYLNLDLRQDEVRVLQPLYNEGQEVQFGFDNYTEKVERSKENYSAALYKLAMQEMKGGTQGARKAYKHFEQLIYVNPTYKSNLDELIQSAKNQGSSFVYVHMKNNINTLAKDSLDGFTRVNSGGFENQWIVFHNDFDRKTTYDYRVDIELDKLTFTAPETKTQTVQQEGRVQDGWQYQLDANGNVMKDKEGNDIKTAKFKVVRAEVILYQQNKTSKLDGSVQIKNLKTNQILSNSPMFGEAKFQNTYGKYRGDQRAIEQKYYQALQAKEAAYPKDYLFVNYSVSNFKQKLTELLSKQSF